MESIQTSLSGSIKFFFQKETALILICLLSLIKIITSKIENYLYVLDLNLKS